MRIGLASAVALCLLARAWTPLTTPGPGKASETAGRVPILVELFTSEGCSSCPPADAFLQKLDRQPLAGAEMIVLSEHVDYWNHIGWKDPYSARFYSDRQSAYANRFNLDSPYTPQMVVDGNSEFVGSDPELARKAFDRALAVQKVAVRMSAISVDAGNILHAHVETGAVPSDAEVVVAIALNHAESQVLRGENGGRRLTHVGVVQSLTKIAGLEAGKNFSQDVRVKLDSRTDVNNLRVIAFVQQAGQRQVLGAALEKVK